MKLNKKYLYGLVLIILGILLGLDKLGVVTINFFFDGWWTLFIIIPAFIEVLTEKAKKENSILLFLGLLILLICRDIIDLSLIFKLIIPILLIFGGAYLLFNTKVNKKINEIKSINCNNNFKIAAVNKDLSYILENTLFTGMDLEVTRGSINYNLANTIIVDDIVIDCDIFNGEIELSLPEDVNVVVKSTIPTIKIKNNRKICKDLINPKTVYIKLTGIRGKLIIN